MDSHAPVLSSLANHLVQQNLLSPELAAAAEKAVSQEQISLVRYLVKNNLLDAKTLADTLAEYFGLTVFDLNQYELAWLQSKVLSKELIRHYRAIPLAKENNIQYIGISDPSEKFVIDALAFHTGLSIYPMIVNEQQLQQFIDEHCEIVFANPAAFNQPNSTDDQPTPPRFHEDTTQSDEPVIRFVDDLVQHALRQQASDIHFEPYETECRVRFRQDGILHVITSLPIALATRLVARIKVMAKLNIAERRLPQDGRFQITSANNRSIDFRISTCPTLYGEKIVIRILDASKVSLDINTLGITADQQKLFLKSIAQPQGMILVTGPTGSGKTVTLYSALATLNTLEKNIVTVEDPVEINLPGINQVNTNSKIGLDFANVLRAFLRQDPDIIMVGEIRDLETAEIAINAAQTGHLVLATLHTNGAIEALTRLINMEIAPFNIADSVSLIVAQRLVRKLCQHCKEACSLPPKNLKISADLPGAQNPVTIYNARGCKHCQGGYTGRTGVYEFLPISETIRHSIMTQASSASILAQAQQNGFKSLRQIGNKKVLQGITSLTELDRVIHE